MTRSGAVRRFRRAPLTRAPTPEHELADTLEGQRIGANLEFHHFTQRAFAAFDMPNQMSSIIRPECATFPATVRIVDAPIETSVIEAERVGDPKLGPFIGLGIERQERIRIRSSSDRRVFPKTRDIVLIHPQIVVKISWDVRALERGTIGSVQRPSLLAVGTVYGFRPIQDFALGPVEAREMTTACERRPNEPVAVDIDTAWIESRIGHLV
jgi:hypothetical protein